MNDDQRETGRVPRTLDCELTRQLGAFAVSFHAVTSQLEHDVLVSVDSCLPGDSVTVSGVVKVMSNSEEARGRKQKDKSMFLLYVDANSVSSDKSASGGSGANFDFSMTDLYAVQEIQEQPDLFKLLVHSLAPSIYGHEMVKAGLLLGLFGGTQRRADDKLRGAVRGDPHVLVVGDPGLGKSQLLHAIANVAPRSVYVCGNTSTTSGLTVTLTKV